MKTPIGTDRITGIRQRKPCKILYWQVWFGDVHVTDTTTKTGWKNIGATLKAIK